MTVILLVMSLAQGAPCDPDDRAALAAAGVRVAEFDLVGAAERLSESTPGCPSTDVALVYLRGLVAAREAARLGGSPAALVPLREAIDALDAHASLPAAAVARAVLQAARAAAQSERDEMALFLDHAIQLERLQLAVGAPGAPLITAHEAAGDLYLQVHRYDAARSAYVRAAGQVGVTRRVNLGLARVAWRLDDVPAACGAYAMVVVGAEMGPAPASEFAEARAFLERPECRPSQ